MATISVVDVDKRLDGTRNALTGVNLEVRHQELLTVVGPNGSGKTTLLRMIAGLEQPTVGTVRVGDRLAVEAARDRRISMVFQNSSLQPQMSVRDNLLFGARLRRGRWCAALKSAWLGGRASSAEEVEVRALARRLGIERLLDRRPRELSGGERGRVAVGRALLSRSDVVLLDEPLANADAVARMTLAREIRAIHETSDCTTVYVTHDQVEALAIGDRVVVLDQGQVAQVGTPDEVFFEPASRRVAEFVGEPRVNLFPARLEPQCLIGADQGESLSQGAVGIRVGETLVGWLAEGSVRGDLAGRPPVWVGFRPQRGSVWPGVTQGELASEGAGDLRVLEGLQPGGLQFQARVVGGCWVQGFRFVSLRPSWIPEVNFGRDVDSAAERCLQARVDEAGSFSPGTLVRVRVPGEDVLVFDFANGMSRRENCWQANSWRANSRQGK